MCVICATRMCWRSCRMPPIVFPLQEVSHYSPLDTTKGPLMVVSKQWFELLNLSLTTHLSEEDKRATTNVQNGLVFSSYSPLFSFISLLEQKPLILRESPGGGSSENVFKKSEKVCKSVEIARRILPGAVALRFSLILPS